MLNRYVVKQGVFPYLAENGWEEVQLDQQSIKWLQILKKAMNSGPKQNLTELLDKEADVFQDGIKHIKAKTACRGRNS